MSKKLDNAKIALLTLVALGIATLVISTLLQSSFFVILGFSLLFWGVILLYITPTKNGYLELLNAGVEPGSENIERLLSERGLTQKGIYLPIKNGNTETSNGSPAFEQTGDVLVFIPETQNANGKEDDSPLKKSRSKDLYIAPPGQALCKMFEQRMGKSFSKIDIQQFEQIMPTVLTKDLKLAEAVDIQTNENIISIEITKSVLEQICQRANNQPLMHKQVGCLLTSAIACALAKVTGKPITIESETLDSNERTTSIRYQITTE